MIVNLGAAPVPDQPAPPLVMDAYHEIAKDHWREARAAYINVLTLTAKVQPPLFGVRYVDTGTARGALDDAKKLRDWVDDMVVSLDAIVSAAERTRR